MIRPSKQRGRIVPAFGVATSIAAPVNGWNSRDALADMEPQYAVKLTNMVPRNTFCEVRDGYSQFATGLPGQVNTVLAYSGAATDKLFAASTTKIYNITAGGAVGAADLSGLTNDKFQYVNNTTAGGNYIQAVNGVDKMIVYDGTNWHADGDGSPYNVTGVDTATCIGIGLSHNRVWLIQNASLKAWYLPTQSIGGAATAFDLSSFCERGGYLMAIIDWTMDAGYGMDDMTVFITNKGEVLVYRGSDPASTATWGLVGRYWIGSPVGRRCFVKYKGDVLIICQEGVQPLSLALQSSRLNPRISLTDVIQPSMSSAVTNYGSYYGWQMLPFPMENLLFLNVPVGIVGSQQQYVMNTITQAWANFTGWGANCWELYQDKPYFGGNTFVGKAWDTLADAGANITFNGFQAFNYFKTPGLNKQFTQMRPVVNTNGSPAISVQVNVDFDLSDPTAAGSVGASGFGVWRTTSIDAATDQWNHALWASDNSIQKIWQGATGIGKCGAPHITGNINGQTFQWMSTDLIYKKGGFI